MSFIPRLGQADIVIASGQSVIVGSFGAGQTKIYYGNNVPNAPVVFALQAVLAQGSVVLSPAAGTTVRIEASPACEVEYDFGAQPALTNNPYAATTGLTAFAGGGQGSATPLTGNINRITVCATIADSVKLPAALVGRRVSVYNAGATSANVFPQTGENINSGAANAAFAVATTKGAIFECVATGVWNAVLSA